MVQMLGHTDAPPVVAWIALSTVLNDLRHAYDGFPRHEVKATLSLRLLPALVVGDDLFTAEWVCHTFPPVMVSSVWILAAVALKIRYRHKKQTL